MPPTPLEKVLALRPTNVVAQLGAQSRLPVLNPRDLLAAAEGRSQALVCIPVYSTAMAEAALKAARDQDAVIGVACPYPLSDRDSPARFVAALSAAAEEVRHRRPFFLQAGPLRLGSPEPRARELLAGAVFRYVDAGFTLVSLDASALEVEDAAAAYRELAGAALERELSVEVAAPVDEVGRVEPERCRALLEALAEQDVLVQFLRVPGTAYALEPAPTQSWQLDLSVLSGVAAVAASFKVAVSVEEEGPAPDGLASALLEGGARKIDPAEACARAALAAWPPELREAKAEEAAAMGVRPRDLIASAEGARAPDAAGQLRTEAATWAMAVELLAKAGARGSATRALGVLSQGGRY